MRDAEVGQHGSGWQQSVRGKQANLAEFVDRFRYQVGGEEHQEYGRAVKQQLQVNPARRDENEPARAAGERDSDQRADDGIFSLRAGAEENNRLDPFAPDRDEGEQSHAECLAAGNGHLCLALNHVSCFVAENVQHH